MLQIQQLTATKYITCEQQQQIYGSGAGPHNINISKDAEELWTGYASGDYNVSKTTDDGNPVAKFTETRGTDNSDKTYTVGTIAL
jgi:hypothetical protein